MSNPFMLPNQLPEVIVPGTSPQPTILQLGAWNALSDTFVAHSASVTGNILNLNDGQMFTLVDDGQGLGSGLDVGATTPDIYQTGNPRTIGQYVTRINYGQNRQIVARLLWGQGTTYGAWISALRNLATLCAGISPSQPAALQIQVTGASTPVYADVLAAYTNIRYKETLWHQLMDDEVVVVLTCRPFLRGARRWLANLAVNPGFDAPSGAGVGVFADAFANVNAYTVAAGSAPTTGPANDFVDVLLANSASLLRYHRLVETTGTIAYDIAGSGLAGTYSATGIALANTALVSGDTAKGAQFTASSSGKVTCPSGSGLPTGNGAFTMGALVQIGSLPIALATIGGYGATGAKTGGNLWVDTAGKVNCDLSGNAGQVTSAAALTTGARHLCVVTWDGTTLRLYVDGAATGTPTTPGANAVAANPALNIGANNTGNNPFNGIMQEFFFCGTALSAGQISNVWTAANSGASGTVANAMSVPNGTLLQFGSPAWSAYNTWKTRFRWITGLNIFCYLHYLDASHFLRAQYSGSVFSLVHDVNGTVNTIATNGSTPLVPEGWYWLQVTQYPSVPGDAPQIQASLSYDNNGAQGAQIAVIAAAASDAVTALAGKPALQTSGTGTLAIGGNADGSGHAFNLFGPGGWFVVRGSGTGLASGAWDTAQGSPTYAPSNLPPLGLANAANGGSVQVPVSSVGAARVDLAPAGTVDAIWTNYFGGAPAGTNAIPVAAGGDTLAVTAAVASTGLGVSAQILLQVLEYDANGNFLARSGTAAAVTGNQASWVALYGSYVTSVSCAYVALQLRVLDSTTGSIGGTVWFDNVQAWDMTATGQTSMPYCAMRFAQSPAHLMVSGIQGDVPAPAQIALGTYLANEGFASTLSYMIGRRARVHADTQLVTACADTVTSMTPVLDPTSYGGFYLTATRTTPTSVGSLIVSGRPVTVQGAFYALLRAYTTEAAGNLANVTYGVGMNTSETNWELPVPFGSSLNEVDNAQSGSFRAFAASSTWTVASAGNTTGPLVLPPFVRPALADLTQNYQQVFASIVNNNSGTSPQTRLNAALLLPVDGGLVSGSLLLGNTITTQWLWIYADGLGVQNGAPVGNVVSLETGPIPNEAHAFGGPGGGSSSALVSVNGAAAPYLTLDPGLKVDGVSVNQFGAYISDNNGAVLALYADIQYTPLYLYPI